MAQNKKEKLLEALKETQGLIYHACKKAGNVFLTIVNTLPVSCNAFTINN